MTKLLVFFATYNEAGNVTPLLTSIASTTPDADILVVDDNSSDGTVEVMRGLSLPQLNVIVRKGKLGLGTAHILALLYARAHNYDIVVTMDGDLSHDPAHLPALLEKIADGSDLSIGSRYMPGGSCDYGGYRLYVSRMANISARLLLGIKLHEFTTSYRAFNVASLRRIDFATLLVGGYSFFLTTIAEAASRGLRISEIPIHFHERGYGTSKIPAFEVFRGMGNLLRLAFRKMIGINHPSPSEDMHPCISCGTRYSFVRQSSKPAYNGTIIKGTCVFCGTRRE